jgi:hypothetical protein
VSRGFDGFEIDDFRDSGWERDSRSSDREASQGRGGNSAADRSTARKLERLREAEHSLDVFSRLPQERSNQTRPPLPREEQQRSTLSNSRQAIYPLRDIAYSLRDSEVHTLSEVGRFRVADTADLAQFAYSGDRSRMERDVSNLVRQGLVEQHGTSVLKQDSRQVLALTKRGQGLIRRHSFVPEDQAIYSGFVKPKEADHDANLYRLYQRAADEIERKGGKVLRVQLDYELKEQLYRKLGKAQARQEGQLQRQKTEFARELHLPVVQGKVSFPDLRIEYATQEMEIARVDVELATSHYHAGHLAQKARAGFQIYARPEDTAGLRRVRDEREITIAILSL